MRVIGAGNDHANVDAVGVPGAGAAIGVPGAAVGAAVGVAAVLLAAIIAKSSSSESSHAGRMFDIGTKRMRMA